MGKTSFQLNDLAPLAGSNGHRVAYTSLWQTFGSPIAVLLNDFHESLKAGSAVERIKPHAAEMSPTFRVRAPGGFAEVELSVSG